MDDYRYNFYFVVPVYNEAKNLPLRYLVWVLIVLLFNIAELIHFHIQLWYTLPIL